MTTNKIRFKKDWFNPVYFHLRHYIDNPKIRKILVYGGKDSAKTFSICQLLNIICHKDSCSAVLFRKEQSTIKTTLKRSFKKSIESVYMDQAWEQYDFKYLGNNGNEVVFRGLDTEEKVKGIEGYKYLFFDELDHYELQEWEQANLSLRGQPNCKLFAAWNPVDENIWIKKELDAIKWVEMPRIIGDNQHSQLDENSFVQLSEDGSTLLIKVTYLDNKWTVGGDGYGYRNEALIAQYQAMKEKDENFYNVNVLGLWGVTDKNIKFAYNFSREKHVKNYMPALIETYGVPYNPEYVVWLSFDFNVDPMTCTAMQKYSDILFVLKCFRLRNSGTEEICDVIRAYFQKGTVFYVTGDASGEARSTMASDGSHNYTIIQKKLKLQDQQLFIPTKNPDIKKNRTLLNYVLKHHEVWIQEGQEYCDPDGKGLIYDLTYVEIKDGEMAKDRTTDKKKADFLDNFRYYINIDFANFLEDL